MQSVHAGSWSSTGSLHTGRYSHTATLLPGGQVLVAGGSDSNLTPLSSAELYDPAAGNWSVTGSMAKIREYHTATLLPNGKVLVAGGSSDGVGALVQAGAVRPGDRQMDGGTADERRTQVSHGDAADQWRRAGRWRR